MDLYINQMQADLKLALIDMLSLILGINVFSDIEYPHDELNICSDVDQAFAVFCNSVDILQHVLKEKFTIVNCQCCYEVRMGGMPSIGRGWGNGIYYRLDPHEQL